MNSKRMLIKAMGGAVLYPALAGASSSAASAESRARYFPNAVLTTHENRQVKFYDDLVRGKVVVINRHC
jgi:protein SCO1/2